jgi:hypothetical protein
MKKKAKKLIVNAWQTLVVTLEDMRRDHEESVDIYIELLELLPGTTIVEENSRDKNLYIQGIVDLCTYGEFKVLSPIQKRNRTLAFRFNVHGRAIINRGFYDGPQLFSGTWLKTLEFIMGKIYKSHLRQNLSDDQRQAFKKLIGQLKSTSN